MGKFVSDELTWPQRDLPQGTGPSEMGALLEYLGGKEKLPLRKLAAWTDVNVAKRAAL